MRFLGTLALFTVLIVVRTGFTEGFWLPFGIAVVAALLIWLVELSLPAPALPALPAGAPPAALPARARTALGKAVAARLEARRVEHQGGVELVSGQVSGRSVTLRLGAGRDGTVLSFDLPWRAAYDLDPATLPSEVAARVAAGGGSDGLEDPEAALVDLFGPLRCVRLQARARRAHLTLRVDELDPEDAPAWAHRALSLVSRLDGLIRAPIVIDRASLDVSGLVCPYCRDAVAGADATACPGCGTVHHVECLAEAGGCTILGCSAQPRREPRLRG